MDGEVDYDFFDDEQPSSQDVQHSSKKVHSPPARTTVKEDLTQQLTSSSSDSSSSDESADDLHGTNDSSTKEKSPVASKSSIRSSSDTAEANSDKNDSESSEDDMKKSHNSTYIVKHVSSRKKKRRSKSYSKNMASSSKVESTDSDVTDVSPLPSPPVSPVFHRKRESKPKETDDPPTNMRHITKLNVVFRDSASGDGLREHTGHKPTKTRISSPHGELGDTQAQRKVHDEHWSSSSDEREQEVSEKRKSSKKDLRTRRDLAFHNHRKRLLDSSARESMEICSLLETVLEFEKKKQEAKEMRHRQKFIGNMDGNTQSRSRRKNMSFSNEQVRNIDSENQRLLREITKMNARRSRPSSASSMRSVSSVQSNSSIQSRSSTSSRASRYSVSKRKDDKPTKLYHSAINRINYQRQIERENLQLLKRLQNAKPTSGMRRQAQLDEYRQQTQYMGTTIDRNGMSVQRAHELTRNADVVRDAIGLGRSRHARPAWQDSW